jgi:hypothetical protein
VLVAEGLYRNGRAYGDSVVIVKIPKRIWEPAYIIAKGNEITLPQIGYWNEGRKQYAIKPEFVRGWIDRETDELHLR